VITCVKEVMDFVYDSYFTRQEVSRARPLDGSHPQDDRNNRRPDLALSMLQALNRPDKKGVNVLVTGSKGKGSVSRLLEGILRTHGFKTGLFTSPHLHIYNERILVNGQMISDDDLIDMANYVQPVSKTLQKSLKEGDYISPMANGLSMAMTYFKHMETDYNILECGRGARFDDVAVSHSDFAVINVIFDEHIPYLGESLVDVAWHKAGVIHRGQTNVFSALQDSDVMSVLNQEAEKQNVKINTVDGIHPDILLHINQSYNQANAQLAYDAAKGILGDVFKHEITMGSILEYPFSGCLEQISAEPNIFIDGCIHPVCAKEIADGFNDSSHKRAIIGIPDNKAYKEVVHTLIEHMECTILSQPADCHLPFSGEQGTFAQSLKKDGKSIYYIAELEKAIEQTLTDLPTSGELYIVGTQIYLGQVKSILKRRGII